MEFDARLSAHGAYKSKISTMSVCPYIYTDITYIPLHLYRFHRCILFLCRRHGHLCVLRSLF